MTNPQTRGPLVAVVPALNEARHIAKVIGTMPRLVEVIVLVDDGSSDGTAEAARAVRDDRLVVLRNESPRGVGAAIATGYDWARASGARCTVVLAGDGQMDPTDLPALIEPVLNGTADYVKGNRLAWPGGAKQFPPARLIGAHLLGAATRLATGLSIEDPQCGYTAISVRAIEVLAREEPWTSYGYPNDVLIKLARADLRVREVPVRPIYGTEQSKLRLHHLPPIAALLGRAMVDRATRQYLRAGSAVPERHPRA